MQNEPIETIYFGGGTPTLLPVSDLEILLARIFENFKITENAEITIEANPDDVTKEKLAELKILPINRLSIGIQSFFENELKWMNRSHDANQAEECVINAQNIGLENISIDLIYGVPGSDLKSWEMNLKKAINLSVPHVSSYCLTVEPKTALSSFVKKGK